MAAKLHKSKAQHATWHGTARELRGLPLQASLAEAAIEDPGTCDHSNCQRAGRVCILQDTEPDCYRAATYKFYITCNAAVCRCMPCPCL